MREHDTALTAAEWRVMECLWERSPLSGRELTEQMCGLCGWSRSTTLTLLGRMEAKGAIAGNTDAGKKKYSPLIRREDIALKETKDFLSRVYKGSLIMMVNTFTRKQPLSEKELDELYAILKELEAGRDACKLEIFIPATHLAPLQRVLQEVDAGHIGNYDCCLSYSPVTGCWRPLEGTSPYLGSEGEISREPELKVEVTIRTERIDETIAAIKRIHPYEEPVINAIPLWRTGF